jgi:hypothetical protein
MFLNHDRNTSPDAEAPQYYDKVSDNGKTHRNQKVPDNNTPKTLRHRGDQWSPEYTPLKSSEALASLYPIYHDVICVNVTLNYLYFYMHRCLYRPMAIRTKNLSKYLYRLMHFRREKQNNNQDHASLPNVFIVLWILGLGQMSLSSYDLRTFRLH